MRISEVTRRDIIDTILVEQVSWSGRLEEPEFLSRLFDLQKLPSTDSRFNNAFGDIRQHRIYNYDWEDDWFFYDSRFNLLRAEDETFLQFLCEMLHPVVRHDSEEVQRLKQAFNAVLIRDGYELVERAKISGRPVFAARLVVASGANALQSVKELFQDAGATYVLKQITRMEAAIHDDPGLAIGTAKELVETVCKTILSERDVEIEGTPNVPKLVKQTTKLLALTPSDIPEAAKARGTIRVLLSNFATITQGIAELRNHYGTGHGKGATVKGLQPRHAKLAVGAASTLAVFLLETHEEQNE